MHACECFNMSCTIVVRYGSYVWRGVFIGKCLRSAQMKLFSLLKVLQGGVLRQRDKLQKLSFTQKPACSCNVGLINKKV